MQVTDLLDVSQLIEKDQSAFIFSSNNPISFLVNLLGGNGNPNFIQTNCWLIPKSVLQKGGVWRPFRCPDDDGEFFSRMILASEGIVHVEGVYNYYYMSPTANQLSTNMKPKYIMNKLLSIDLKHQYLKRAGGHPNLDHAIALQYFYFAIFHYPHSTRFSNIAYKRYQSFNLSIPLPLMGGRFIMMLAKVFGWKVARLFRYYAREKSQ